MSSLLFLGDCSVVCTEMATILAKVMEGVSEY